MHNNPVHRESQVTHVGSNINFNPVLYNDGADQPVQLHTSVMQIFKLNELEEDNSMEDEEYERMLCNCEIVKNFFGDYIVNKDGYNNLGQPGYKLH